MAGVLVRFGSKGGVEFDATRGFGGAGEAGRVDSELRGMLLGSVGRERLVHDCGKRGMVDERGLAWDDQKWTGCEKVTGTAVKVAGSVSGRSDRIERRAVMRVRARRKRGGLVF